MSKNQKIVLVVIFLLTFLLMCMLGLVFNSKLKGTQNTNNANSSTASLSSLFAKSANSVQSSAFSPTAISNSNTIQSSSSQFSITQSSNNSSVISAVFDISNYQDKIVAKTQKTSIVSLDADTLNDSLIQLTQIIPAADNVDLSQYLFTYDNRKVKLVSKGVELITSFQYQNKEYYILSKFNFPHSNSLAIATDDFSKIVDLPVNESYYPKDNSGNVLNEMYIKKMETANENVLIDWTISDGRNVKINNYQIKTKDLANLLQ